jgi:hypothetical protein
VRYTASLCGSPCRLAFGLCLHVLQNDTLLPVNCSETRTLQSQLSTLQEQYQRSQAAQQESESQLAAARAKLKAAEELAASQSACSAKLQQGLTAAESELKRAQQATHEAREELLQVKRQAACRVEQAAPAHTEAEVRPAGRRAQWMSPLETELTNTLPCVSQVASLQAQFVAEEAHSTAEAAAKLLAQKVAGNTEPSCGAGTQTHVRTPGSRLCSGCNAKADLQPVVTLNPQRHSGRRRSSTGWQMRLSRSCASNCLTS